jgi:hypothetical protein
VGFQTLRLRSSRQGFDELHPDHSLAVRSIAEYVETTSFADQFLLIDASASQARR